MRTRRQARALPGAGLARRTKPRTMATAAARAVVLVLGDLVLGVRVQVYFQQIADAADFAR
ncbi:hypothetical protein QIS99_28035, partial [Streptomyces sp. B-S-A8]